MKILLTGCMGQVGWELERQLARRGTVIATDRSILDVGDPDAIRRVVREAKPKVIVNAAAYTSVERAESEPHLAMRINGKAPGILAEESKRLGALLIHYSTDYVFDGAKKEPYLERDATHPLNAYGMSKLEGERAVLASGCRHLVLRTSWVYAARGNNFLRTILRRAREHADLRVVADQVGAPTSAAAIAVATVSLLEASDPEGLFHMSAAGETSWHGFAEEIVARARLPVRVVAISSEEYPGVAKRPSNSVLDNAKLRDAYNVVLETWQRQLAEVMSQLEREATVKNTAGRAS